MADDDSQQGHRLIVFAEQGDQQQVEALLHSGGDAAYQDPSDGRSALIAAASEGHTEVVRTLLAAGAPWNAFDRQANCAGDYALAGQHERSS